MELLLLMTKEKDLDLDLFLMTMDEVLDLLLMTMDAMDVSELWDITINMETGVLWRIVRSPDPALNKNSARPSLPKFI